MNFIFTHISSKVYVALHCEILIIQVTYACESPWKLQTRPGSATSKQLSVSDSQPQRSKYITDVLFYNSL